MKKSLIAAAALTAFAGAAAAQSSVTISGVLDAGYNSFSTQAGTAAKATQRGVAFNGVDSSRLNLTALEDMGGGLKAGAVVETWLSDIPRYGFDYKTKGAVSGATGTTPSAAGDIGFATKTATSLGDRLFYANLVSGNSEIRLGKQSAFLRDIATAYQADGANLVGNAVANDGVLAGRMAAATYLYNANGFTFGAAMLQNVAEKDGTADVKTATGETFKLAYATGPLSVAAAYQRTKTSTAAGSTAVTWSATNTAATGVTYTTATEVGSGYWKTTAAAAATDVKTTASILAASYDFGVAKAFAQYGKVKADDNLANSADSDRHFTSVGFRAPVGKVELRAQYTMGKATYGNIDTGYKGDVTGYTAVALYNFSKRTSAYVGYGQTEQDTSASATTKATNYAVGMIHAF